MNNGRIYDLPNMSYSATARIPVDDGTTVGSLELSDIGVGQVSAIYRWQSDITHNQYTWFEIWPDGWCRQGGETHKLYDLSGNCNIELPIAVQNVGKTNVIASGIHYSISTDLSNSVYYTFIKEGSTQTSLKIQNSKNRNTKNNDAFFGRQKVSVTQSFARLQTSQPNTLQQEHGLRISLA